MTELRLRHKEKLALFLTLFSSPRLVVKSFSLCLSFNFAIFLFVNLFFFTLINDINHQAKDMWDQKEGALDNP